VASFKDDLAGTTTPSVLTVIFPDEPGLAGFIGAKEMEVVSSDYWSLLNI